MRRISVINQKGGVGKTTSTVNVGGALAASGKRVLLIDFDPQAHLTLHLGVDVADEQPTAYDLLTQSTPIAEVAVTARENLSVIPADIDLAAAEAELISVMGREVILREAIASVEDDFDVMLIDCPPSLGVLTINALAASNEVIIPLQAQFFALQGLSKLLETVSLVQQRINRNLLVSGVLLCIHESTTRLGGEVVEDLEQFLDGARDNQTPWSNARLYRTRIRRNIKLAEASSFGQTVIEYAPKSNGAVDYTDFARELYGEPPLAPAVPRNSTGIVAATIEAEAAAVRSGVDIHKDRPAMAEEAIVPRSAAPAADADPVSVPGLRTANAPEPFDPPELEDTCVPLSSPKEAHGFRGARDDEETDTTSLLNRAYSDAQTSQASPTAQDGGLA